MQCSTREPPFYWIKFTSGMCNFWRNEIREVSPAANRDILGSVQYIQNFATLPLPEQGCSVSSENKIKKQKQQSNTMHEVHA